MKFLKLLKWSSPVIAVGTLSIPALIWANSSSKHQITTFLSSQNRKLLDFDGNKDDQEWDKLLAQYQYDYLNFAKVGNKKVDREEMKKKCKALLSESYSSSNYEKASRWCSPIRKVTEVMENIGVTQRNETEWTNFKNEYGNVQEIQELAEHLKANCSKYGSRETISFLYERSMKLYADFCISDSNKSKIPDDLLSPSKKAGTGGKFKLINYQGFSYLSETGPIENPKNQNILESEKYELASSDDDWDKLIQNSTYDYLSFIKTSGKTLTKDELKEKCKKLLDDPFKEEDYKKGAVWCTKLKTLKERISKFGVKFKSDEEWSKFGSNIYSSPEAQTLADQLKTKCNQISNKNTISALNERNTKFILQFCLSEEESGDLEVLKQKYSSIK